MSNTGSYTFLPLAALAAAVILGVFSGQPTLSVAQMAGFLIQDVCLDTTARIVSTLPFDPLCPDRRLQTLNDVAPYRKHDRPNIGQLSDLPLGYEASDSVAGTARSLTLAVQTMDIGDPPRRFGVFDTNPDDAGQVIVVRNGAAYIALTQDAGRHGLQWFLSPLCGFAGDYGARFESWLIFRNDAETGAWREAIADLSISPSEDACPSVFSRALTRYRRELVPFPVFQQDVDGIWRETSVTIDTIISEHYGRGSIAEADHLERLYFADGLGMVRWERWEQLGKTLLTDVAERASALAAVRRCPHVPYSDAPGQNWRMIDCRMWTTFELMKEPWRVADYGWPPTLAAFDR